MQYSLLTHMVKIGDKVNFVNKGYETVDATVDAIFKTEGKDILNLSYGDKQINSVCHKSVAEKNAEDKKYLYWEEKEKSKPKKELKIPKTTK